MTITQAGQPPAGENSPTRLILFAAIRMAAHYRLPHLGKLRKLVRHENDELALHRLIQAFAELAVDEVGENGDHDPAISLARSAVAATTIVWKVRTVAQGAQAAAPSHEAWELFALIATVVYHRSRTKNTTLQLLEFVESMAGQISEL